MLQFRRCLLRVSLLAVFLSFGQGPIAADEFPAAAWKTASPERDRKSTRLNSSHSQISYAVFCLNKHTPAFPELDAWERAGPVASSARMVHAGFENQNELTKMQLDNQKEIAEMQNKTQKEIAGIQSATSRQNTNDQVYAQNEMLAYQPKESTARVASIMENTNPSSQQHVYDTI